MSSRTWSAARKVIPERMVFLLKDRSFLHVERRLYHLGMGLGCFALYALTPMTRLQALGCLLIIGGTWAILDSLRLRIPALNRAALLVFGRLMRREEAFSLSSNTYYIFGMIAVVWLFPPTVAQLSILYLAVGDPVAALVGTRYGRHRLLGKKSVEGFVANLATCCAFTVLAGLTIYGLDPARAVALGILGGIAGALAEILPIPGDDNFNIPVFSATFLLAADRLFAFGLF